MNSYLIWIPSIQEYLRFKELTNRQHRIILKVLDDREVEFIYHLNQILADNIVSKFNIDKLTIIDRFIIFLGMKINSCGTIMKLTNKCIKCGNSTTSSIDLNEIITILVRGGIDRNFQSTVKYNPYSLICDIPSIDTEYEIFKHNIIFNIDKDSPDINMDNHLISHIKALHINKDKIDLSKLSYNERIEIIRQLPASLTDKVYKQFLTPINNKIKESAFISFQCTNKKCKEYSPFYLELNNINDFTKVLFRDESLESMLSNMAFVCNKLQVGADFLSTISPREVDILINRAEQMNAAERESTSQGPTDMFSETLHMKESPSEFS